MNYSIARLSLLIVVCCFSACDAEQKEFEEMLKQQQAQEESPDYAVVRPIPIELEQGMPEADQKEMLSVADATHPAKWLLSQYQQLSAHDVHRDVFYYSILLARIEKNVHEDQRVIANRIVQVSNQLKEKSIAVTHDELLNGFADYLENKANKTYVFGELIANYSNLRQQGRDHFQSLELLFELLQKQ
jgi:hypothetical protein